MIDITPIINSLILVLAAVITVILIPYIKSKTTETQQMIIAAVVQTAVFGFEQIVVGEGRGEEKFRLAILKIQADLAKYKIAFNSEEIRLLIEAAVKQLNIEQSVMSPLKE